MEVSKNTKATESEDAKRQAHEQAEAKRKAEWEAKKKAREEKIQVEWEKAVAVDDDALIASSVKRLGDATERLTRRNMKLCVTEFVQTKCYEDVAFAKQVMHPRKNMRNCFRYISQKAKEYLEEEMKLNDEENEDHYIGGDVPDELCYEWAVEYFYDMNVDVDKDKNEDEKFVPRPYVPPRTSKPKKKADPAKEKPAKAQQEPQQANQISLFEVDDAAKKDEQGATVQ